MVSYVPKLKHSMLSLACCVYLADFSISLHSSLLVLTIPSYQSDLVTKHTMLEFSGSCASSLPLFLAVSIRFTDRPCLHYLLIFETLHLFLQVEIIELRTCLKSRPRGQLPKGSIGCRNTQKGCSAIHFTRQLPFNIPVQKFG